MEDKETHPPNKANFSFPSTLVHKILPEAHTSQVFEKPSEMELTSDLETSMDLILACPFVVHIS